VYSLLIHILFKSQILRILLLLDTNLLSFNHVSLIVKLFFLLSHLSNKIFQHIYLVLFVFDHTLVEVDSGVFFAILVILLQIIILTHINTGCHVIILIFDSLTHRNAATARGNSIEQKYHSKHSCYNNNF